MNDSNKKKIFKKKRILKKKNPHTNMYILLIALFLVSLEYVISSNRSGCTTCIATATTVSKEWCRESTGCVDDDDEERHCRETCAANEFEIVTNIMIVL